MKVKETIAFIGDADKSSALIQRLAAKDYPLVLVRQEGKHFEDLREKILSSAPEADIETIGCEREGCWEADIIVYSPTAVGNAERCEKIKEVANQKILVYLFNKEKESSHAAEKIKNCGRLLPNTKTVLLVFDPVAGEIQIGGPDDAAGTVENIFRQTAYKVVRLETTTGPGVI